MTGMIFMSRVLGRAMFILILGLPLAAFGAVPEVGTVGEVSSQEVDPSAAEVVEVEADEMTWFTERVAERVVGSGATALWSKGNKLRAETVVNGHPVITIVNGSTYYMIDGLNGAGWAVQRHQAALDLEKKRPRPFGNEGERMMEEGAEVVRTERVMGVRCDVYRLTDNRGQREVWVTQTDPRVPVRLEIYNRASGKTAVTRYLGWVGGHLTIPDPFFLPDPRYSIEEMSYDVYIDRKMAGPENMMPVLFPELLSGR
jgi:hypothetical protein